jgi:hypothetical protein
MAHTGFPSSGPCSGGSSDPFFSPLCVLCSSALSSLPPRFAFSVPTVCHSAYPDCGQRKRTDQRLRHYRKESTFPPVLSQRAHESKTRANNYCIFNNIQTRICTTPLESGSCKSREGVFHKPPSAANPEWDSQRFSIARFLRYESWLSSRSFHRRPNESRPQ